MRCARALKSMLHAKRSHFRVLQVCAASFVWLSLSGCERKAPSIEQCQQMAARLLGVTDRRMLRSPEIRAKFEQVAFECLTTPYDRDLVRCLASSADKQMCVIEFRQRSKRLTAK